MTRLAAVITANGLGHYRRTAGIIARLLERGADVDHVDVLAEPWQRDLTSDWHATQTLERRGATWIHDVIAPGVSWSSDPRLYDDGRLTAWEERLAGVDALQAADLVVSDNLSAVLELRPDAVLAGNFLWSDVLGDAYPESAAVSAFVELERRRLERCRPPMLCVAELLMPGIRRRTEAVPFGFMCDPVSRLPQERDTIAVLAGRGGAADDILATAAAELVDRGYEVRSSIPGTGASLFDFSEEAWSRVGVLVCRPGTGTVTEAVARRIPMVVLDEGSNAEMQHNRERVLALGIGLDAGSRPEPHAVAIRAEDLRAGGEAQRRRLAALPRDGIDEAAEWLAERLGVGLDPR